MASPMRPVTGPGAVPLAPAVEKQSSQYPDTAASAQGGCCASLDFGGDENVQKAAKRAHDLVDEWQAKLASLGVKVVMGGSLASGLALPGEVHDMDVRFLYDGDRTKLIAEIEQATGLLFRKSITLAEGRGKPGWDAHLIEGRITREGVTFDVEGALRNTNYTGWAQHYPEVLSPQELADARRRKLELRDDKKAYRAYKDLLLETVKQRMRARGLQDQED